MQVTRKSRLHIRLQNIAFVVLFIAAMGLLAWLSTRYTYQSDWSFGARNTLSEPSRLLLGTLKGPIEITAFTADTGNLRKGIANLVARFQRVKSDIKLEFVDPNQDPERTRAQGISVGGELLISYHGRSEKLQDLSEQGLSNALQRVGRQHLAQVLPDRDRIFDDEHTQPGHDCCTNWRTCSRNSACANSLFTT